MGVLTTLPELEADGFLGLDDQADAERLPLGAFTSMRGARVDENGNLVSIGSLTDSGLGAGPMGKAAYYARNDELTVLRLSSTTANVFDVPRDLSGETSRGTFGITSGNKIATLVELYEKMFISVYKDSLHYLDDTTVTELVSADTDLDSDADSTDKLLFAAISEYQGHLLGFGFGDEQGTGGEETNDLGPDRPEIVRWSHLGQPLKWRPENWMMVGVRGLPCLQGISAFGRHAIFKPDGVYLLYGDLEQNFGQVELLQSEAGVQTGGLSMNGACFYDSALYWMSRAGPMRWIGARRAEYIGRAVEGTMTPVYRNSSFAVFPIPELRLIAFVGTREIPWPLPGDPPPGSGTQSQLIWLWDTRRERWVGHGELYSGAVSSGNAFGGFSVVPLDDGTRTPICGEQADVGVFTFGTDVAGDAIIEADDWVLKTGIVSFNGKRGGILRGLVLEGDWAAMSNGWLALTVKSDGGQTTLRSGRLYIRGTDPFAAESPTEEFAFSNIDDTHDIGNAPRGFGQAFTSSSNQPIRQVIVQLAKNGSPRGQVRMAIYQTSGSIPNAFPTGGPVAVSDPVAISTLGASLAEVTFTFPNPFTPTAPEVLAWALEYDDPDDNDGLAIGTDESSPAHAGNFVSGNNPPAYTNFGTLLMACFELYQFPTTKVAEGDLWYDTTNDYCLEWDGGKWVRQPGVPEGVARLALDAHARDVQVWIEVDAVGSPVAVESLIRRMALQVRPQT